jgi:thiamine-monophosphate kinase
VEQAFLKWLTGRLTPSPQVVVPVGDDGAVLRWSPGADLVAVIDTITDEVDFQLLHVEPEQIGHKAVGVNLSDLAAMAARPVALLSALTLPRGDRSGWQPGELARRITEGMLQLARQFDVPLVGGDTGTWDGPLVVTVTALGETSHPGPWTRSGAQPGDAVLVTGELGGSLLGRHLHVQPRVKEALAIQRVARVSAAIDISDGLALDASRLAAASNLGLALDLAKIPLSAAARQQAARSGRTPLDHALGDGEDFELLLCVSVDDAVRLIRNPPLSMPLAQIGVCVPSPGLWQRDESGRLSPLAASGYEHGETPSPRPRPED